MVIARDAASKADIDFQGKDENELFQFQFHQHWIRLLWPFCKLLLWNTLVFSIGTAIFLYGSFESEFVRRILLTFLTAFFVMAHLEFLKRFYSFLLYVVIVTDKKIHRIKKSLFCIDDHKSVDLWMAQDIQMSQNGLIQNILGFGTMVIEAQETVVSVHFAPQVRKKYEKLLRLRERARSVMGYVGGRVVEQKKQKK